MATKANVEPLAFDGHAWQLAIPFIAPGVSVIMATEQCHQARRGRDSFHKWYILSAIRAGAIGNTIGTCALCLLCEWEIVVDARLSMGVHAGFCLECETSVRWDVNEGDGRKCLPIEANNLCLCCFEPIHHALIDPIGLSDFLASRIPLLIIEAA